mmetsp:Transcript_7578/g.22232  ORF Transcript_7578/g.22232 Transcript_7578/m.22232 type:complete len:129 (+) Transcript_7578:593-979(+)
MSLSLTCGYNPRFWIFNFPLFAARVRHRTVPERDGYTPMHGAGFQGRASIAKILSDHGVNLRDKHPGDGHEPAIRACWGGEPRHLETVKFFLKAGVPLDDIYEPCVQMTRNSATKKFLEDLKEKKEEL